MSAAILVAYLVMGVAAARFVRQRIGVKKTLPIYDKEKHARWCPVQYRDKPTCDCNRGTQGMEEAVVLGSVLTILGAIPFWPVYIVGVLIFADGPKRRPALTDTELTRLEREAGIRDA